jgi:hypothetical protein
MTAKMKFPKTLGACVDLALTLRDDRLAFQREIEEKLEALKAKESEIEEHILASFDKSDIEGAKGSIASASVSRLVVPAVKDWPKAFAYIAKHKAWDLMEKRMARVAFRDRTEAGEVIPGVESFTKVGLNLSRINKEE